MLNDHDSLQRWESVPFPSPIHTSLDYVYTIDQDAGFFIISLWDELTPSAIRIDLARIHEAPESFITCPLQQHPRYVSGDDDETDTCESQKTQVETPVSRVLDIDFGVPSPLNELQGQLFTDFVFVWRSYIDDPLTWRYSSPVFNVLCTAILRIAAWDFEVSFDPNVELPVSFASIPLWKYPDADIYWFHGYLVVLQGDVGSEAATSRAILKARLYTQDTGFKHRDVYMILLSPRHVAFIELSNDEILVSSSLSLLTNCSAAQPSPGFRALARVLTSDCWKKSLAHRERWGFSFPPEILHLILDEMEPRDAVAFAQASLLAEQYYYASVSQFKNVDVRSFKLSVPCCGERNGLEENGVCCTRCHCWRHLGCVRLENMLPSKEEEYVCTSCLDIAFAAALDPGGINRVSRRRNREGSKIKVGDSAVKSLQLRLAKPSHLRPELRFLGNLVSVAPSLVDYTILFNGSFSGLAYGLEDT